MKITIELTEIEAKAAMVATSNYTPRGGNWQQAAQARAKSKIELAVMNFQLKENMKQD